MVRGRRFTPLAVSTVLVAALAVDHPGGQRRHCGGRHGGARRARRAVLLRPGPQGLRRHGAQRGSKVWFTVADGVLSDVYEPTIDNTNVEHAAVRRHRRRTRFTDLQSPRHDLHGSRRPTGMACTVTATSAAHGYRLVTTLHHRPGPRHRR